RTTALRTLGKVMRIQFINPLHLKAHGSQIRNHPPKNPTANPHDKTAHREVNQKRVGTSAAPLQRRGVDRCAITRDGETDLTGKKGEQQWRTEMARMAPLMNRRSACRSRRSRPATATSLCRPRRSASRRSEIG